MADTLFTLEETETFAKAARDLIDARLQQLPDEMKLDFWGIVAKGYCMAELSEPDAASVEV